VHRVTLAAATYLARRSTSSSFDDFNLAALTAVRELYEVADYSSVFFFLRRNSFLVPLILGTHAEIVSSFGPTARARLEVLADPGSRSSAQLLVVILTNLTVPEAMGRLDVLDERWWLRVLPLARNMMSIDFARS
jgi:hypothetical protein